MEIARGSRARAKSKGERLHPCLVPRCNKKGGDLSWLVKTVDLGQAYSIFKRVMNLSPKPNFLRVANMYLHSI